MPFEPYDAATDALDRSQAMLDGARRAGRVFIGLREGRRRYRAARLSTDVRDDMRRLSVVMAVAALDTYMHRLIVQRVYAHAELPGGLANLDLPFAALLDQADQAVAARKAGKNSRPRVVVKRQLRDRLLRETFQNYDSVSRALSMAGLGGKGKWQRIGEHMNPPMEPDGIKARLNAIVVRRNQIVHEGDYRRLDRPQDAKRNPMTVREADIHLAFIRSLVDAIHATL